MNGTEDSGEGRHVRPRRSQPRGRAILAGGLAVAAVVGGVLLLRACQPAEPDVVRAVAVGDMACDPTDPKFAGGAGTDGWCQQRALMALVMVGLAFRFGVKAGDGGGASTAMSTPGLGTASTPSKRAWVGAQVGGTTP